MADLFSVCESCDYVKPLDGNRLFGDFDRCEKCNQIMNLWTGAALRRQMERTNDGTEL